VADDYREGDQEVRENTEVPEEQEEQQVGMAAEPGNAPPGQTRPGVDEEAYTAVLLIQRKDGAVVAVTDLTNLKLVRRASPHQVLQMCNDVAAQISELRTVGELARVVHGMLNAPREGAVDRIAQQVGQMLFRMQCGPSAGKGPRA